MPPTTDAPTAPDPLTLDARRAPYVHPVLTDTHKREILRFIGASSCNPVPTMMKRLGVNMPQAREWLADMVREGLVLHLSIPGQPVEYLLIDTTLDMRLVREDLTETLISALRRAPAMASGLAATLRLNPAEVRETCRWLAQHGRLETRQVGHAVVYSTESTLVIRAAPTARPGHATRRRNRS